MAFEAVDTDGNGTIDTDELFETMNDVAKHLNLAAPNKDILELRDICDKAQYYNVHLQHDCRRCHIPRESRVCPEFCRHVSGCHCSWQG